MPAMISCLSLAAWAAAVVGLAAAARAEEPKPVIRVDIVGQLETGVIAVGGETTGTVIRVDKIVWELDLGDDKQLAKQAEALSGGWARVQGVYTERPGVEVPVRKLVRVKKLSPAAGRE